MGNSDRLCADEDETYPYYIFADENGRGVLSYKETLLAAFLQGLRRRGHKVRALPLNWTTTSALTDCEFQV